MLIQNARPLIQLSLSLSLSLYPARSLSLVLRTWPAPHWHLPRYVYAMVKTAEKAEAEKAEAESR